MGTGEEKQKQKKKQRSSRGNGHLLETLPNLTEYSEIYNVEADRWTIQVAWESSADASWCYAALTLKFHVNLLLNIPGNILEPTQWEGFRGRFRWYLPWGRVVWLNQLLYGARSRHSKFHNPPPNPPLSLLMLAAINTLSPPITLF